MNYLNKAGTCLINICLLPYSTKYDCENIVKQTRNKIQWKFLEFT